MPSAVFIAPPSLATVSFGEDDCRQQDNGNRPAADAAKALLAKALADLSHPQLRVINADQAKCYPPAVDESKEE